VADLVPAPRIPAAVARIEELERSDTDGIVALPGSADLLASLPADRWAIVTSGVRPLAEARIRAAGLPVPKVLVTADDVARGKPDPEPFLLAATMLGAPPARCVVLEDAPAGLAAAHAAGMRSVGVTTTYPAEELDADLIIQDLSALRVIATDVLRVIT